MAGTNEFAFFRCQSICTGGGGGVQNQAEKKIEKCLPAGTGTKIYFSRMKAFQSKIPDTGSHVQGVDCRYRFKEEESIRNTEARPPSIAWNYGYRSGCRQGNFCSDSKE